MLSDRDRREGEVLCSCEGGIRGTVEGDTSAELFSESEVEG
jgi:hypothetical protein